MLQLINFSLTLNNQTLFDNVDFNLNKGEICCIATGVLDGGTSLLKCCAGIMQPSKGTVLIEGKDILQLTDSQLFKSVRYCYELLGLIRIFSVFDNLFIPMMYHNIAPKNEIKRKIYSVAEKLEMTDILFHEPMELNDVQMRLVNVARGMIVEPKVLLVDEIQAGVSDEMRDNILNVLITQSRALNQSLIITTTAGDRDEFADSRYSINNDKIVKEN